ncbi:hypothetical protein [Haloactinomyces albus]|uniref:Membrane protein YgcG n=1 Tax=Haloactinomyces albus TaxID=1352928 RepID=A0AAE3ZBX9_9ACTN|nr:hypothetical protein [Haloactinomyces albus]MDR7301025.1 putative membrane protein YgcG [Haloactinomyces albus]
MGTAVALIVILVLLIGGAVWWYQYRAAAKQRDLDDAKAEARRWVERLGGQVLNLIGTNEAAKQALADASERHNAAGSQMEQADTPEKCRLTTQTALEGLYYVRAARVAMDMDPGPELPDLVGQRGAGAVTEYREVDVEGQHQVASPHPTEQTPHYYPGGRVAGRPVPRGWYSEPWWKPALVAGAWGFGSFMLMGALFGGMAGVPAAAASPEEFPEGDAGDMGDGGDMGGDGGDMGDMGGGDMGGGGFDLGGFDIGGF